MHGAVIPAKDLQSSKRILGSCRLLFQPMPPPRVSFPALVA